MLSELLQDRAALYVSGAMTEPERDGFEVILEFHDELRSHVTGLQDVVTAIVMAHVPPAAAPPAELRARLLGALDGLPRPSEPDGLVVANGGGLVEWVNPAFTALCGFSLAEIKGRKPGHLLQGPKTDVAAVARIRAALQARRPSHETLVNYHKDGTLYRVDVRITPILDDDRQPLWFVAKERKLPLDDEIVTGGTTAQRP
jgi:PAS domain S-box-containing protein